MVGAWPNAGGTGVIGVVAKPVGVAISHGGTVGGRDSLHAGGAIGWWRAGVAVSSGGGRGGVCHLLHEEAS